MPYHYVITLMYPGGEFLSMSGIITPPHGVDRMRVYMDLLAQAQQQSGRSDGVVVFWSLEPNALQTLPAPMTTPAVPAASAEEASAATTRGNR
ncbi:hypothetical protein TH66_00275 [Carbonactinospora thermoautotrophica]|uniref:Uncharacterized protein n=1 Tax=Carbonactinospora thermoautotrophica TaxID=1469144 RepID=A0A132NIV2_9ACTN|nr:hypothetical protein [Carbonactinospora thermoautotrophica]KWX05986.1 hypothetical protein TH66_00275 [Carbonactinospora thermoautotrophica]KWX09847.1 hypothetical protein TR74_07160 [Carbonactinospora thermoautotrophica]